MEMNPVQRSVIVLANRSGVMRGVNNGSVSWSEFSKQPIYEACSVILSYWYPCSRYARWVALRAHEVLFDQIKDKPLCRDLVSDADITKNELCVRLMLTMSVHFSSEFRNVLIQETSSDSVSLFVKGLECEFEAVAKGVSPSYVGVPKTASDLVYSDFSRYVLGVSGMFSCIFGPVVDTGRV